MNKSLTLWGMAFCLPFSLVACTDEAPVIDTGIHGIEVPSGVVVSKHDTRREGIYEGVVYEAELPNWEFEDVIGWMETRLPVGESFDGMEYSIKESERRDNEYTKSWHWSGLSRKNECHILIVAVIDAEMGEPVKIGIGDGVDLPDTCKKWLNSGAVIEIPGK